MPDVSIMISAQDNYSSAVKAMGQVTKSFSKDADHMEDILHKLSANKVTLKMDADNALRELKAAQKQFAATGTAEDRLRMQMAQTNYDNVRRNLDLVTRGAREAERQMRQTGDSIRREGNRINGGAGGGTSAMLGQLAKAGMTRMIGESLSNAAGVIVGSAFGGNAGTMFSSTLSGAATGAAMGSIVPGIGTAIGAAVGGLTGAINGGAQIFSKKDDAFKGYVQENTETQLAQRDSDIKSGSGIAAGRETDLISFSTMFKSEDTAKGYLKDLVAMANNTPFLYGDLTAMSKTLATYKYEADGILPVLNTIGDTGAALGMDTSDMNMVSTTIGRMKSSNKTTLEYLNILNDRGIGAVGMLSDAYGVDQGTMYDMISKGKVKGGKAVEIILAALTESYAGSMEEQSKTFAGRTSTLEGMNQEMQNAYGEGYNEERKGGIEKEIDWLSGASGEAQQETNKAIGAWKASLENAKEQYIRDAVEGAMETDEYKKAKAADDAAEMGRIIMAAKVKGQNEYNANEGKDEELASELSLAASIRDDARSNDAYWDAGYRKGEEYSKGLAAAMRDAASTVYVGERAMQDAYGTPALDDSASDPVAYTKRMIDIYQQNASSHAYGLDRVPRDNFPALLHEGERVLTANEARQQDRGGGLSVQITGPVTVREEADIEKIARDIVRQAARAKLLRAPKR